MEVPFSLQTSLILLTFLSRGSFTVRIRFCCTMRSKVLHGWLRMNPGSGKFLFAGEAGKIKKIGYRTCFAGDSRFVFYYMDMGCFME